MSARKREVMAVLAEEFLAAGIREVGGSNQGEFVTWFQREVDGGTADPRRSDRRRDGDPRRG